MITLTEALTTYWTQTTFVILAIVYFIKRFFDNQSKKIEINYNLFQQRRLEAFNKFFINYAKAEQMWKMINVNQIMYKRVSAKELDDIIFPFLNDLKTNLLELRMFISDKEYSFFKQISDNMESIQVKLSNDFFDSTELIDMIKSIDFEHFLLEKTNCNEELFKQISLIVQENFLDTSPTWIKWFKKKVSRK